jgi:hypothetical protein
MKRMGLWLRGEEISITLTVRMSTIDLVTLMTGTMKRMRMRKLLRLKRSKELAKKSTSLAPTKSKIIDMPRLKLGLTRKAREEGEKTLFLLNVGAIDPEAFLSLEEVIDQDCLEILYLQGIMLVYLEPPLLL